MAPPSRQCNAPCRLVHPLVFDRKKDTYLSTSTLRFRFSTKRLRALPKNKNSVERKTFEHLFRHLEDHDRAAKGRSERSLSDMVPNMGIKLVISESPAKETTLKEVKSN